MPVLLVRRCIIDFIFRLSIGFSIGAVSGCAVVSACGVGLISWDKTSGSFAIGVPVGPRFHEISMPQFQHQHAPQQSGSISASAKMFIDERTNHRRLEISALQGARLQQDSPELVLRSLRIHSTSGI